MRASTLVYFFASAAALWAQEYRGRIQGTVTDESSASIAGANITLRETATNASQARQTDPSGRYLFDLVEPGSYTISVEAKGFAIYRQQNIVIRQRGDITIDIPLRLASVSNEVTVTAEAAQVQFNSGKLDTTIDKQIAQNLPQIIRDPFFLSKVDPSVVQSETRLESQPYHSTGTGTQQVGGVNGMDLQVDGAPVGLGTFTGYVPAPDMVQEVNVQVNALDAEFGQSTGSAISIALKSGSNQIHGGVFYQGIYPWANAILNRVSRIPNIQRNHMSGGSIGHPIIKNRWFNFAAFEGWQLTDPQTVTGELPTALERKGDFSQSLNANGALRVIYDPWSTTTSANGSTVTRIPVPGNVMPASTISKVATAYAAALPQPTLPGVGNYHARNFVAPLALSTPYRNFTDRTDVHINDRLRYSGRFSIIRTTISASNPLGSDLAWLSDRGSNRHSFQQSNEVTWVKTANTVISGSVAISGWIDEASPSSSFAGYDSLWPNNTWYKNIFESGAIPKVSPGMRITMADGAAIVSSYSSGIGTNGPYWRKHQLQNYVALKIANNHGKHYLKAGLETRGARSWQLPQINYPYFTFDATATANTYVNPDTRVSGDGFASFLFGAINGGSMAERVNTELHTRSYAWYLNDDWKVTRRLTLNLGLRWEYETPYNEVENRAARGVDLTVPIPDFQGSGAPQMPEQVKQFYTGSWTLNGSYRWTESGHRSQWNSTYGTLSPRAGVAFRLNNKTSLRAGWGRYYTPLLNNGTITQGNFYGFSLDPGVPAPLQGVPQMSLDNPFPSTFPLQTLPGKTLGQYTGLGDNLSWIIADRPRQHLDRVNASVQRELPWGIVADATFFINYFNAPTSRNINQVDPRIAYTYKAATNISVANPFYQILTPAKFPGPLRNQSGIPLSSLMVPYPQYGSLTVTDYDNTGETHFRQFSMRVRKAATHGLTFIAGYSFTFSDSLVYYDDIATYLQRRTWQQDTQPRHRITFGGNWELPFGHGRYFLKSLPRALDAIVGGWNVSPLLTWRSGNFVAFPGLVVSGDVTVPDPGPNGWFNTAAFSRLPAYTPRSNPVIYDGVTGPGFFNLDTSLTKSFRITERFAAHLRLDSFNTPNKMTWNDPSNNISSTFFGKSSDQFNLNGVGVGRTTQLGLRVTF